MVVGSVFDHALLRERQGLIIVVNSGELHHVVVGAQLVLPGVEVLDRSLLVYITEFEWAASFKENALGVLGAGVSLFTAADAATFISNTLKLRRVVRESTKTLELEWDDTDSSLRVGVARAARVASRLLAVAAAVVVRFAAGTMHLTDSGVSVLVHDAPIIQLCKRAVLEVHGVLL
jgi:hypothetical protein